MISTTSDFQNAALSNYRKPKARVRVTWTDSAIDTTLVVTSNDDNRGALNQQVVDGIDVTTRKWAHLNDSIVADGSFYPMPALPSEGQLGWYGATACDGSGVWPGTNPLLTVGFTSRPIINLQLTGDTVYNEYPVDFTIRLYDGVTLLATHIVTGNTELSQNVDLSSYSINSCDSFTLEMEKWSAVNQVAKINECYASIVDIFYGDEIVDLTILEEMQVENGSLPIGNISANQLNLSLSDDNRRFQYGNTDSLYHTLLKKNRKVEVWLGFVLPSGTTDVSSGDYIVETIEGEKVGFLPYGLYWTNDWLSNIRDAHVSTSARDLMEILRTTDYDKSPIWERRTLYQIAVDVMAEAENEIIGLNYVIDTDLQNYTIPIAWFPKQSFFKTIKSIVSAGKTIAYVDRTNVLYIGKTI